LEVEGARKEALDLRSKLRLAEKGSTASDLFERYELEIGSLSAALSRAEDELISMKCMSSEAASSSDSALAMLRRSVRQQQRDIDRLRRENEEMRKHQRSVMSSKKLMDDMTKKISQFNKVVVQKDENIASKTQQLLEYEDLIRMQHQELQQTKSSEMELTSRCAALSENVSELQRQVAELTSSRRSARFIPALAPSSPSVSGLLRNSAADLCNKLERDCGASNPRCHTWIVKLRDIIEV
jgi:chromosome segregation ATPase